MKRFTKQLLLFFLFGSPLVFMPVIGYFYFDPFKVLYSYDDYSYPFVYTNRDYISTEMFLKNYPKYAFNSFIFGSSRTLAFKPVSWLKYLDSGDNPFVFDASNESIYGIYTKIKFLDSINVKIDNALIVICRDVSFANFEDHKGHLNRKHPLIIKGNNLDFQMEFLIAYFSPKFLQNYYAYLILNEFRPFMAQYIERRKISFDTITNETIIQDQEIELAKNPDEYYYKRKDLFYNRQGEQIDSVKRIYKKQLFMLEEVKRILEKNKTNYRIIISPLYEQIKFSENDFNILKNLFGDNLYDFSGKNTLTESQTNYFEASHYRKKVGDSIFKIIYNEPISFLKEQSTGKDSTVVQQ